MSKYISWGLAVLAYASVACTGTGGKNSATTSADSFAVNSTIDYSDIDSIIDCSNSDSIATIVIEDSIPPFVNKPEVHPYHQIEIRYLDFKNSKALQAEINKQFFSEDLSSISGLSTQEVAQKLYREIKQEFQSEADGDLEHLESSKGWKHYLVMELVKNNNRHLAVRITEYIHTGGAHGNRGIFYTNFDKERNQRITESDIFVEDYKEALASVIQDQLAKDLKVGSVERLSEVGLFDPQGIEPNGNFLLTESGIRYCYIPYEIGPYGMGHIYVHLSWDSVRELIRPGSIAEQYIK